MRVLYVASRFDYGIREAGPSFEEETFYAAWKRMPDDLEAFDAFQLATEQGQRVASAEFRRVVAEFEPDVCFFVLIDKELTLDDIEWASSKTITVNWFCDDHWRFEKFSCHFAKRLHLSVTTDEDSLDKYARLGLNALLMQWASPYGAEIREVGSLEHQSLLFVGRRYGPRASALSRLQRAGLVVTAHGSGWSLGRVGFKDMTAQMRDSRATLNFSTASNPRWTRKKQIKARVFEVLGAGGLLLTEDAPHLNEYVVPGTECLVWSRPSELIDAAAWAMEHLDEAKSIAEAGLRRVASEHTYDRRLQEILNRVLPAKDLPSEL